MSYADLTPAQKDAVNAWWQANDPDQIEFDFVDNTRYAVKGNVDQEIAYESIRDGGCCGFDTELEVEGGEILLFGFNYGHYGH